MACKFFRRTMVWLLLGILAAGGLADSLGAQGSVKAVINANPKSGPAPLTVQFDGGASWVSPFCDPRPNPLHLSYSWNFGDGQQATGVRVAHTYSTPGQYTASLTFKHAFCGQDTAGIVITVTGQAFLVARIQPSTVNAQTGQTISFDGRGSTTAPSCVINVYRWTFGDGTGASGSVVTKTYSSVGTFTVTLTVGDTCQRTASASVNITVTSGTGPPPRSGPGAGVKAIAYTNIGAAYLLVLYADGTVKLVLPPTPPAQQALVITTLQILLPTGQSLATVASLEDVAQGLSNTLYLLSSDGRVFWVHYPTPLPVGLAIGTVFGCTKVQELPTGIADIAGSPTSNAVWAIAPGWAWRLFTPAIGIPPGTCPTGTTVSEFTSSALGSLEALATDSVFGFLSVFWVLARETPTGAYRVYSKNAFQPDTASPPCAQGCALPATVTGAVSIAAHTFTNRYWILQQDGTIRLITTDGQVLLSFQAP